MVENLESRCPIVATMNCSPSRLSQSPSDADHNDEIEKSCMDENTPMHDLVESSVDPIVLIDCEGNIRLANPACCECFQYAQSELIGKNISILMPQPHASNHTSYIKHYLETGIPRVVEKGRKGRRLPAKRRDGSIFPMFLTLSEAIVNRERLFYGVMRSLSTEEEERQVLAAMIDSCVDPIVVITTQGIIERCNPACTKVFGFTKEELIGGNVTMLMPQPHATNHQTYINNYLKKSHRSEHAKKSCPSHVIGQGREVTGRTKSGQEFPIFLSVSEFHVESTNNTRHGFIGIMRNMEDLIERKKSEALLTNVLPHHICTRLKAEYQHHEKIEIADSFDNVTICFADIVGFTEFSSNRSPMQVVHYLNKIFRGFDNLVDKYNLEKIKTIGDAYMVVAGLDGDSDHAYKSIHFALDILDVVSTLNDEINADGKHKFGIRIGLHTGSVVAGLVGTKRRFFDLWGDAVNIASRMESSGIPDCIHCTDEVAVEAMKFPKDFIVIPRGSMDVKGKGVMRTFVIAAKGKKSLTIEQLELHRAHKRRASYLMHKKLGEEFNLETRDVRGLQPKGSSSFIVLIVTFLLGAITGQYYPQLFFKIQSRIVNKK